MANWRSFTSGEPPHTADDWWPVEDPAVGSADLGSNYLWDVRIRLQLRLENDVIVDARCLVEDDDSDGFEQDISASIVAFLKGKTPTQALDLRRPPPASPVPRAKAGPAAHPADIMWHVGFAEDAIREALEDWARKAPPMPRFATIPPPPPDPEPPARAPKPKGLIGRLLSRIGL